MKMRACWLALGLYGVAAAQSVFTDGIDVNGQAVQNIGLINLGGTNLSVAPSVAQLMGLDPITQAILTDTSYLIPLRTWALATDSIFARTPSGLTLFDENTNAVLVIQGGMMVGAGGVLSNFTLSANSITSGQLSPAVLPSGLGTVWDAGGLVLSNMTLGGNIGIGTASPGYTLDVAGDINIAGNIYQNGNMVSGGGLPFPDAGQAALTNLSYLQINGYYTELKMGPSHAQIIRISGAQNDYGGTVWYFQHGSGGWPGGVNFYILGARQDESVCMPLITFHPLTNGDPTLGARIILNGTAATRVDDDGTHAAVQTIGEQSARAFVVSANGNTTPFSYAMDSTGENPVWVDGDGLPNSLLMAGTNADVTAATLTVTGAATLPYIVTQGDIPMGSYTNQTPDEEQQSMQARQQYRQQAALLRQPRVPEITTGDPVTNQVSSPLRTRL